MTVTPMRPPEQRPTPVLPDPTTVLLLQAATGQPSVSVLLRTAPADRMRPADVATLRTLVAEAEARLAQEAPPEAAAAARAALRRQVERALELPTRQALAVYASASVELVLHLPLPVEDRVVVDPTFATRDLVRSLHRTPRHLVLLLSEHEARLFDGVGDDLRPVQGSAFPLVAPPRQRGTGPEATAVWCRTVDRALAAHVLSHPAPLVLVAAERTAAAFRRVSRTTGRLAGVVTGSHVRDPLERLVPRIRAVLDEYLHRREQEALHLLERRRSQSRAVTGMGACWLAARHEPVEMLVVDPSRTFPARVSADGDFLEPATDPTAPAVLDDAIDELIELVLLRGGWVAFASSAPVLAETDGVALTLRSSYGSAD